MPYEDEDFIAGKSVASIVALLKRKTKKIKIKVPQADELVSFACLNLKERRAERVYTVENSSSVLGFL